MRQERAQQGDTLDLICWRYYRRTGGVTESVLEANPGLADYGVIIPHGTLINLPDIATTQTAETELLQLWD